MGRVERLGAAGLAATAAVLALTAAACVNAGARDAARSPAPDPLATVHDTPGEGMRVLPQADGPLYDAPPDVEQTVVCDRDNRMYILLRTPEGGIAITPYLDRDGSQRIMPRP